MAAAEDHEGEGEGVVTLEDKDDSVLHPLLHKPQDDGDEHHKADVADGRDTSAPRELEVARRGCSLSECHICCGSGDDHHITSLNCNHTLCHHCVAGIMRQARDPGRLRCPFCRQTTPFPQWEIRRLQEESYSNSVCEAAPVTSPGPRPQAVESSPLCCFTHTRAGVCGYGVYASCLDGEPRWTQPLSLCFAITALLLLSLVMLGCFLYLLIPDVILSVLFRKV